ncbi:hypothetical protein OHA77_29105 [Streptosporangium sp. NBC_01639]|uniref:hypothetical protein n=1 Tax=Streptosporangium sp. NBC_01639 TaxID=2975948 RepID=UPI00386B90DF|nr:hypothetical protein OHA77_29105 [Streptosporangium sp. NBC_01639]
MDTEPLRMLPAVDMTVFLLVCAAFLRHRPGAGLLPDGANNRWPTWTAAVLTTAGAAAVPPLSLTAQRPGEDR